MGNRLTRSINRTWTRQRLNRTDFQSIPNFTFKGQVITAKVISVYDGDTITIGFLWRGRPFKKSLRLYGIDTPELKPSKNDPTYQLHKLAGHAVACWVESQLLNQIVQIQFTREDKYGRLMGCLYLEEPIPCYEQIMDNSFNQLLINKQLAVPYTGQRKEPFTSHFLQHIIQSLDS